MRKVIIPILLLIIAKLLHAQAEYPEFAGGESACLRFIEANLDYSLLDSVADNIEGDVTVAAKFDTLGNIASVRVKKKLHPKLDEEALRIVCLMPRWKPYRINGKPKDWDSTLVVNFTNSQRPASVNYADWRRLPEFPGGMENCVNYMHRFIISNYKEEIVHIFGEAVIVPRGAYSLIVTDKGKIRKIRTMLESNKVLEKIALHAFSQMPEWEPGINVRGDTCSCLYVFPLQWNVIYQKIQMGNGNSTLP